MKKLKYVLIALAVIVICIAGYIVYELNFKSYDTADPEVDALVEETFDLELPDGTVVKVDKEGNVVETKESENKSTNEKIVATNSNSNADSNDNDKETGTGDTNSEGDSTSTSSNQAGKSNNSSTETNKPEQKVTVFTIKSKYENTFKMLENQSRARLNALISQAANEYSTKKSNGESISYGYFYKKYMGAARGIESSTDSTVNYVVGLVEKDLQANGFDKSYAQSFAEQYKATKEALRGEMMDKALNFR